MEQTYRRLFKYLLSLVLLMNLMALTSCKKNSSSDSSQGTGHNDSQPLETDEEVEVGVDEGDESFGE